MNFTRDGQRNDGTAGVPFQDGERMDDLKIFVGKPTDAKRCDLVVDDVIFFATDPDLPPEPEPFPKLAAGADSTSARRAPGAGNGPMGPLRVCAATTGWDRPKDPWTSDPWVVLITRLAVTAPTPAQEASAVTAATLKPQGLAAAYPGDEGIERDPRVLFVEDFETGTVLDLGDRWGNATQPENLSFSPDIPPTSPGNRSLRIAKTGHLFTHTRGVDRMHARFYVKFHPKIGYIHHFVTLWADRTPTPWPKGWAGKQPSGDALFSSGIEPWHDWNKYPPPGVWHFYSYWHEMKPDGVGHYWGNFFNAPQEPIEPGRWYCVEAMLQANSKPEATDGEQAFWVDGKLTGHFKGIRWRSSDKLKLNSFWLLDYVSDEVMKQSNEKYPDRVYEVWFDDIVVATDYIGPVQEKPKGGKKLAAPGRSALLTPGLLLPPPGKVVFSEI